MEKDFDIEISKAYIKVQLAITKKILIYTEANDSEDSINSYKNRILKPVTGKKQINYKGAHQNHTTLLNTNPQ